MIPRIHVREPPVAKLPLLRPTAPLSFLPYSTTEDLKTRTCQVSEDFRAACKTLIDSERRKNTQASSDVGARQLARF